MKRDLFDTWALTELDAVESALAEWVPADAPAGLGEAMRYGVLDGGKRLRPLLVLAAARPRCAARATRRLRAACAAEMIILPLHDDCRAWTTKCFARQDDGARALRVAQAMLAGDAMQALACEGRLPPTGRARADATLRSPRPRLRLSRMAGARRSIIAAWDASLRAALCEMPGKRAARAPRAHVGAACGDEDGARAGRARRYGARSASRSDRRRHLARRRLRHACKTEARPHRRKPTSRRSASSRAHAPPPCARGARRAGGSGHCRNDRPRGARRQHSDREADRCREAAARHTTTTRTTWPVSKPGAQQLATELARRPHPTPRASRRTAATVANIARRVRSPCTRSTAEPHRLGSPTDISAQEPPGGATGWRRCAS